MYTSTLVDDERWVGIDIQKSIHWMDYGFEQPEYVQDPLEAFTKICESPPDVIFTDIRMPGMNGIELIQALRKENINSEIVILSAYEDFETAQLALRMNVTDYCIKPIQVERFESVLDVLVEKLNQNSGEIVPSTEEQPRYSELVDQIIDFIKENIHKKITLTEIADKFYLNKNYLCSLFHEETGKTFSSFMTDLRIDRAKHLLEYSDSTIAQIAESLSYCDNYYFAKVFKKKAGVSPNSYRKSVRP